jgi:hypothetical protein
MTVRIAIRPKTQRVLHGRGIQPRCLQACNHFRPAEAVGEEAMHEDDVASLRRRKRGGHGAGRVQRSGGAGNQRG